VSEKTKEEKLAEQMIKEMQAAGMTPDEMLKCIRNAREMYKELKQGEKGRK
jgi:hypothetical protein